MSAPCLAPKAELDQVHGAGAAEFVEAAEVAHDVAGGVLPERGVSEE